MRRTKIVCTIGPACNSEEKLEQLLLAGMDVARLNFSHGTHEEHAHVVTLLRSLAQRLNHPLAILLDLQGPKIRTGLLHNHEPVHLVDGATVAITSRPVEGTAQEISTTYSDLPRDVKPGDRILLDDGLLELQVQGATATDVNCRVIHGGLLKEHKGINLPGVAVSAPALTAKDREDLEFGVKMRVDYIALSFVRQAADVTEAKELITAQGASIPLISKLEKPEAINNLDAILAVSDGVMVARGDLGVELSPEKVPILQKRIIRRANELGLPVITATQMLESMITNPRPTRAEASDVANAILDGTDAVMLSGETAAGAYPVEAVQMMARIAQEANETNFSNLSGAIGMRYDKISGRSTGHRSNAHAVSHAACSLVRDVNVKALVVFTKSGSSAQIVSKDRPDVLILACTPTLAVYRRLALWWGVIPVLIEMKGHTEQLIKHVDAELCARGFLTGGDHVIIMGALPVMAQARTNFLKLHRIGRGAENEYTLPDTESTHVETTPFPPVR